MNEKIRANYTQWISGQNWDFFFTGTFSKITSPNGARRNTEKFFRGWSTLELGIIFIERGKLYGRVHVHGLLRFDKKYLPPAESIWSAWFDRFGRAKVETPRSQKDVSNYCGKYILKHAKDETYIVL